MKRKHKRLSLVVLALLFLGGAAALILTAFEENIVFFHSPTEIIAKQIRPDQRLRIGGLVEEGTVVKVGDGATINFRVTDLTSTVLVSFRGLLPDLFREGQGIVAEGNYRDGVFFATNVLAKHDENYLPKEVEEALRKSGKWKGAATPTGLPANISAK